MAVEKEIENEEAKNVDAAPKDKNIRLTGRVIYRFLFKYRIVLISAFISAAIMFTIMSAFFCRSYAIGVLKNTFEELEKDLQSIGYDYAYDDINFYLFSPWQIMRAKNFRIYSLDDKNFKQISFKELNVNIGIWNINNIRIFIGSQLAIQKNAEEMKISVNDSDVRVRIKNGEFKELKALLKSVDIQHLMKIDSLFFQMKHQRAPLYFVKLDAKKIRLDDMTGWPLNKQIDHFYLYSSLQGIWENDMTFGESFYDWIDHNGYLAIHKGILNWKPFIMVANGDIRFNENDESTISLNTASLAMVETIDALSENNFISKKGAYVVKLLLNNKGVKQSPTDEYETVVSPVKINKDGLFLENIKLR